MKRGYLSEYFEGVAMKTLSGVDITPAKSNQHEIGTTEDMRAFMGIPEDKEYLSTRFIYLDDESENPVVDDGRLTYYDTRRNQPKRNAEYRCYYTSNRITQMAAEGDTMFVAKRQVGGMLVVVAAKGSTASNQLKWLFGFADLLSDDYAVRAGLESENDRIGFAGTFILESIGIVVEYDATNFLDQMLHKFKGQFPAAKVFSKYARSTLKHLDPRDDPDGVLMAWMEREEMLFRTLEKHLIDAWLRNEFNGEAEQFMQKSLSLQQRRKSRAGSALESHLASVFDALQLRYSTQVRTENNAKPDFLFPGRDEYHDPGFDGGMLTMLGVKTTCKDRWRQVLSEAQRIPNKHLLTLESAISENQTDEMTAWALTLVVPKPLQVSYTVNQQQWLWGVSDFAKFVAVRQRP